VLANFVSLLVFSLHYGFQFTGLNIKKVNINVTTAIYTNAEFHKKGRNTLNELLKLKKMYDVLLLQQKPINLKLGYLHPVACITSGSGVSA
jgi:hypothetical protein